MRLHLPIRLRCLICGALVPTFTLPLSAAVGSTWDPNWGAEGLTNAPDAADPLYSADISTEGVTALVAPPEQSSQYDFGTYTAITLKGQGNAQAIIVGGAASSQSTATGAVTRNSWIAAESGTYSMLVGGSYADNWQGGAVFDFIGNSHIMIDGATVANVMGGNFKDGLGASFTGDSYISIASGNVTGAVVGAGVVTHNRDCAFRGNTNIFVYVPLSSNSGPAINQLPANMILGGFGWSTNTWKTQTLDGSTRVTVDLSNYQGESAEFAKHIVGGGFSGDSANRQTISGGTTVNVNLAQMSLSSTARVVGGHWVNAGSGEINGTAALNISSGTFGSWVVGGCWTDNSGTTTSLGGVEMSLSGGTFNGTVLGGSYLAQGTATFNCGDVSVAVTGGAQLNGALIGGHYITGTGTVEMSGSLGDVELTLADSAAVTSVTGGCFTQRNAPATVISQGDITLNLLSGSISGDVYAAGLQDGSTSMQTSSTAVNIGADVQMSSGAVVSGTYGGTAVSSTVSGLRALSFTSGSVYDMIAGVNFANFDQVMVAAGGEVQLSSFSSDREALTKSGGGNLTLDSHSDFTNLTISGGHLTLQDGVEGSSLTNLQIAAGSTLTGLSGTITAGTGSATALSLALTTGNIGAGAAATPIIFGTESAGADLSIAGTTDISLDISGEGILELLLAHQEALPQVTSYLTLVDGTLHCEDLSQLAINTTLNAYGLRVVGASGGSLLVNGSAEGLYYVTGDPSTTLPHEVTAYRTLGLYTGVIIDAGQELSLQLPGDSNPSTRAVVNNLMGGAGSSLAVSNTSGSGMVTIVLSNQAVADTGDGSLPSLPANSLMQGSISAGDGTELLKYGTGQLEIRGGLQADSLQVREGVLLLSGEQNEVSALQVEGGSVVLGQGSELCLAGPSVMGNGSLKGSGDGSSVLAVDGSLSLDGGSSLSQVALSIVPASAQVDFGTASGVVLSSFNGQGVLRGSGSEIRVTNRADSTFSGTLTGRADLLLAAGPGEVVLDNISASSGWNIRNEGRLTADVTKSASLTLGTLTLGAGSVSRWVFDSDVVGADGLTLGGLVTDPGSSEVELVSTGGRMLRDGDYVLGQVQDATAIRIDGRVELTLTGFAFSQLEPGASYLYTDSSGSIILHAVRSRNNVLLSYADSENSAAGARLMWDATPAGPGDLTEAYAALQQLLSEGETAAARRAMAAVAGSSIATLGPALLDDVQRQLRTIRNRTATMGVDPCVVHRDMPYYNFWAQAEGDYRHLSDSGTAPGYKFERWGASAGVDVDVNPSLTAGLAFTGLYGDLTTSKPDRLEGDVSTWYMSLYARGVMRSWVHTFVATFGRMSADVDRYVRMGDFGYSTYGSTDGYALGFLYELAYSWHPRPDDTSLTFQPLFQLSYRHAQVKGYTEHGSDAALHASSQSMDAMRLSVGARLLSELGENFFNRSTLLECRLLCGVDLGDGAGEPEVALVNGTGAAKVKSAEPGRFGVEMGAGLIVPIGASSGSLFFDGSILLRSRQSEFNGAIGYRLRF